MTLEEPCVLTGGWLPGAWHVVALATYESRQTNRTFLAGLERRIKRSWRVEKTNHAFLAGLERGVRRVDKQITRSDALLAQVGLSPLGGGETRVEGARHA